MIREIFQEITKTKWIDRYFIYLSSLKYHNKLIIRRVIKIKESNRMILYLWKLRVLKPKSKINKIIMMMKNY